MKNKFLKLGMVAAFVLSAGALSAQQTSGDATAADGTTAIGKIEDLSKSSPLNGTIRVVDNKGTKKFLQVKNGLTLLTDTTPAGGIISTWQLGGTLTDNTYIDATGKTFSLDGLKLTAPTAAAATAATDQTVGTNGQALGSGGAAATQTGWTVLIRDEATGEISKLLVSDLVKGGNMTLAATADGTQPTLTDISIPLTVEKVWVYRNGAKLTATIDYTVGVGGIVTVIPSTTAPNDWAIYTGDVFEVQWIQ
jgi:hypothetical protein